jgi:hypothetical protein
MAIESMQEILAVHPYADSEKNAWLSKFTETMTTLTSFKPNSRKSIRLEIGPEGEDKPIVIPIEGLVKLLFIPGTNSLRRAISTKLDVDRYEERTGDEIPTAQFILWMLYGRQNSSLTDREKEIAKKIIRKVSLPSMGLGDVKDDSIKIELKNY